MSKIHAEAMTSFPPNVLTKIAPLDDVFHWAADLLLGYEADKVLLWFSHKPKIAVPLTRHNYRTMRNFYSVKSHSNF